MGLEAGNPVVGGTILRRAAIQSPNFVTGASGWSINQDGSAEFNNLIIRNGEIISGTALYYSGAPSKANLVASISAAAMNDPFGTFVPAGIATYQSSGGNSLVVNLLSTANNAFFQYNAPSGGVQGARILSVSSVGGNDPVTGTHYDPGLSGTDPFFGTFMTSQGAIINMGIGTALSQTGRIQVQQGGGSSSPFIVLFAPEQGVSGHLVMMMQGTSPDGTHPGQLLIAQEPTGFTDPTPLTKSMVEIQANVSSTDPIMTLFALAAGDPIFGSRVIGDANNRIRIDTGGPGNRVRILAGPATTTQDTRLYNAAAAQWASDDIAFNQAGAAEVWQLFSAVSGGFQNGWLNGTDAKAQFRRDAAPQQSITLAGSLTVPAGAASGQTVITLPPAYRPASNQFVVCRDKTGNKVVYLSVGSGGVVAFQQTAGTVATGDILQFAGRIYLDL